MILQAAIAPLTKYWLEDNKKDTVILLKDNYKQIESSAKIGNPLTALRWAMWHSLTTEFKESILSECFCPCNKIGGYYDYTDVNLDILLRQVLPLSVIKTMLKKGEEVVPLSFTPFSDLTSIVIHMKGYTDPRTERLSYSAVITTEKDTPFERSYVLPFRTTSDYRLSLKDRLKKCGFNQDLEALFSDPLSDHYTELYCKEGEVRRWGLEWPQLSTPVN